MEEQLMSLKVDFAFKELMNNEKVRKGFIAVVLNIPVETILKADILNTYLKKENEFDKQGILDVRIQLNDGMQINIEMQVLPFKSWEERVLFYNAKMYVDTIGTGQKYSELKKVVSISILDFDLLPEDYFHNSFSIRNNTKPYRIFSDKMEWHVIEMQKLKVTRDFTNLDDLSLWTAFIKESGENKELVKMLATKNEYLKTAYEELEKISADKQKRLEYETRQKALYDYNTLMYEARQEGKQEGEYNKAIEIAKESLGLGLNVDIISKITGLSVDEIDKLRKSL